MADSIPRSPFLLLSLFLLTLPAGCSDAVFGVAKGTPAPLRGDFPYELEGPTAGHFGGDSFQMNIDGILHFIVIQGVDSPKPGQSFYDQAAQELATLIKRKRVRVQVVGRDSHEREIAFVFVKVPKETTEGPAEFNVGYEIIQRGFGWYDGNKFPDVPKSDASYRRAEKEARVAKRGLWAENNPIPPWEYELP